MEGFIIACIALVVIIIIKNIAVDGCGRNHCRKKKHTL